MKCSKCSATMVEELCMSRSSNMESYSGTLGLVHGHTCWRCGTWVEVGATPKNYNHSTDIGLKRFRDHGKVQRMVGDRLDEVIRLRRSGTTYRDIIERLNLNVSISALQRFYSKCEV